MSRKISLPLINKSHDDQTTECVSCRKAPRVCLKWEEKNHKLICVQFKKSKRRLRKTTTKLSTPSTSTVKSESSAPVLVPRSAWILQTLRNWGCDLLQINKLFEKCYLFYQNTYLPIFIVVKSWLKILHLNLKKFLYRLHVCI